jgi:hypothetical protein
LVFIVDENIGQFQGSYSQVYVELIGQEIDHLKGVLLHLRGDTGIGCSGVQ